MKKMSIAPGNKVYRISDVKKKEKGRVVSKSFTPRGRIYRVAFAYLQRDIDEDLLIRADDPLFDRIIRICLRARQEGYNSVVFVIRNDQEVFKTCIKGYSDGYGVGKRCEENSKGKYKYHVMTELDLGELF